MLPRRSILTGLFGGGGCLVHAAIIDASALHLTGEGGIRRVASEEGLIEG